MRPVRSSSQRLAGCSGAESTCPMRPSARLSWEEGIFSYEPSPRPRYVQLMTIAYPQTESSHDIQVRLCKELYHSVDEWVTQDML
jgi:hypothetical protein